MHTPKRKKERKKKKKHGARKKKKWRLKKSKENEANMRSGLKLSPGDKFAVCWYDQPSADVCVCVQLMGQHNKDVTRRRSRWKAKRQKKGV